MFSAKINKSRRFAKFSILFFNANNKLMAFKYNINKAVHHCSSNIWHTAFIFATALAVAFVGYYIYCSSQVFQPAMALPSNDEAFSSFSSSITKPFFASPSLILYEATIKPCIISTLIGTPEKTFPIEADATGVARLQCDDFLTCHTFILLADYFFIELWLEGAAREGAKPRKNIADRLPGM